VTTGSEFNPRTGDLEVDINWAFDINPVSIKKKGGVLHWFYLGQPLLSPKL
jgi:hypothetical protein